LIAHASALFELCAICPGLGDQADVMIVKIAGYESTSPTINSQVAQLSSSGADIFFNAALTKFASQSIRLAREMGWNARMIVPSISGSIGATIRPLMELVSEGQFRCDLAYQLSTLVIELPALAARLTDLSLLAQMFLEDANARGRHQVGGFTPEALDQLAVYGWPRNLDELAEMVANAHERATTHEVTMRDLPKRILLAADAARFSRRPEESIELEAFMARVEKELIARAMSRAKGNKTRAAKLLGLTRPRLYRKLVQMGLEKDISVQGKAPDDAH
jgi:DNA-binding protein Fis